MNNPLQRTEPFSVVNLICKCNKNSEWRVYSVNGDALHDERLLDVPLVSELQASDYRGALVTCAGYMLMIDRTKAFLLHNVLPTYTLLEAISSISNAMIHHCEDINANESLRFSIKVEVLARLA